MPKRHRESRHRSRSRSVSEDRTTHKLMKLMEDMDKRLKNIENGGHIANRARPAYSPSRPSGSQLGRPSRSSRSADVEPDIASSSVGRISRDGITKSFCHEGSRPRRQHSGFGMGAGAASAIFGFYWRGGNDIWPSAHRIYSNLT